ncbi:rhomboid family intramembrane serine protease [Spiroplasma cantharicola]|uniref:Rhomboid-like protein n=1 Tax=Spiroplasma cantharicola TaxID=362837 RepID=A0A0M4KCX2_9MOLU|nr:rhomboid family intramembrane serine protease [Spiroplasma cantharicola]ALD66665.1 rhomboid-like protein [Spiroplasma cantharicola]
MINFNQLKLNLVHYFVKVEKYKALEKYSNDYVSYLINPKAKFKIIRVTLGSPVTTDKNLNEIKETLKSQKREKIEILNIALSDSDIGIELEGTTFSVSNLENTKIKLKPYFSKIDSIEEPEKETKEDYISDEEMVEILKDPTKSSNLKFKKAIQRMNRNSPISIFLIAIFIIMPSITAVLSLLWFPLTNGLSIDLFFGATNRNLTIVGQQWWRIFTYGFTSNSSGIFMALIQIFVAGSAIKLARYTEGLVGSIKFAIAIFITYPLVGFFVSATVPTQQAVFSGGLGFMASVLGVLAVTTWDKKREPIQLFSKNRMVFPILCLVIYPLFLAQAHLYIMIIASAAISSSIYLLLIYKKETLDKLIILPIIILTISLLLPLTFSLISYYAPAHDPYSVGSLQLYVMKNWMTSEKANSIIIKNGWNWYIDASGNISKWG